MRNTSRKVISLLLTLVMVLSLLPANVFAADEGGTPQTVTASFQIENGFYQVPQELDVKPGLAGSYGYTYGSGIGADDVTALDVLVRMHEIMLTETFTKDTCSDYLAVAPSGYVTKLFGIETSSNGFAVNGAQPHDNTLDESGRYYGGYTINQANVQSGDKLEFFIYQDSYGLDVYTWFEQNGEKVTAPIQAKTGKNITLTLKGYPIGWYGCSPADTISSKTHGVADAKLCTVDEYGSLKPIEGMVTDSDGSVTFSFDAAGKKTISALVPAEAGSGETPIISPLATVDVTATASYPTYENKVYDDFENDLWLQYDYKALNVGETADIFPRRVPQAVDSLVANNVERPNFNFEVVEGDSIKLSTSDSTDKTIVTAVKPGTSIVMVTYDALEPSGKTTYGACSTVNTAYAVFTVGETGSVTPSTDITATSYDTYYFTGDSYPLSFSVNADGARSYSVTCNGKQLAEENGRFVAPLENRSNIIGVVATDANGKTKSFYQVVDARKVEIKLTDKDSTDGRFYAGDTVTVSFRGVTMPIYKLATIYNPCFTANGPWGKSDAAYISYHNDALGDFKGQCSQWNLSTKNSFDVKPAVAGTFTLTNGTIKGDVFAVNIGKDKTDTTTGGTNPEQIYDTIPYTFSKLPDISIEVLPKEAADYPTAVSLDKSSLQLNAGGTAQLSATVTPANAKNAALTWTSSAPSVVSVDSAGKVTALAAGNASITVTTSDGKQSAVCAVQVVPSDTGSKQENKVTLSIDKLTIGKGYTLAAAETELQSGDTVLSLTKRVLDANGIRYDVSNSTGYNSVYFSSIDGDGEFDHGPSSGWMYSVNGTYLDVGCNTYTPKPGDVVRWRYTTNLGGDLGADWKGDSSSGSTNTGSETDTDPKSSVTSPKATVSGNTATVTLPEKSVTDAIAAVQKSGETTIKIAPTDTGKAANINVTIPKSAAQSIVSNTNAALAIETESGTVTIPKATLASITSQAMGDDVKISVEKKTASDITDKTIDAQNAVIATITVASSGKAITSFGGETLTVGIPVDSAYKAGERYKVIILSADGTKDTAAGTCVLKNGKLIVEVGTKHLSTFIVTKEKAAVPAFTDVKTGAWYYDAVQYAVAKNLFSGYSDTSFGPEDAMTRAMLVTVLYRLEGKPVATGISAFTDVATGQWYTDAINWAFANKLIEGYNATTFGTNDPVNREQMAAILYRYAAYKKYDVGGNAGLGGFTDASSVSSYASAALTWAVNAKLLQGSNGKLMPQGVTQRAQVAAILMRFAQNVAK